MTLSMKKVLYLGFRSIFKNAKLIALFWGTNAVAAFLLSLPLFYLLVDNLNHSLMSDKLAASFDFIWYLQFMNIYKSSIGEIPYLFFGTVGVYVLIRSFYMGGLISVFNLPDKNHIVDFFYGGVKYWFRFMKIVLISLIFFGIAFLVNNYLGVFIEWAFSSTENQLAEFIIRLLRYILLVFFIGLVTMISDYAKVSMAVDETKKSFDAIYKSIIFIKHNFSKVFLIFLTIACIGASGAVLYNVVERFIPRTPFYFLFLAFLVQQMLIIFRLFIRMYFTATEVNLYKDLSAEVIELRVKEENMGVV